MNKEEQVKHFEDFVERQKKIMLSKGNDYANDDRLNNFKVAGEVCGIPADVQCLSLIATKVARLGVLLKTRNPNNESIRDSVIDLANYTALLDMILSETEPVANKALFCDNYNNT
tara:strand:+ start:422 stop:766 length:345 start_codon:yes stop_codon:yes gene_type:complete